MNKETQLFKNIFEMQDYLNKNVHPEWKEQGYCWERAIRMEAFEAVDSLRWKWWRKTEPDYGNLIVELVDIFHFLVSYCIVKGIDYSSFYEFFVDTENSYKKEYSFYRIKDNDKNIYLINALEDMILATFGHNVSPHIKNRITFTSILQYFLECWLLMGKDFKDLYKDYIVKNVLNIFRQENGYNAGSYHKRWLINEKYVQDNVIAFNLAEDITSNKNYDLNDLQKDLMDELQEKYNEFLK